MPDPTGPEATSDSLRVASVQVPPAVEARLRSCRSASLNVVPVEPSDIAALLRDPSALPDALVIASGPEDPVRIAQRAASLDRELAVVICVGAERREEILRAVRYAPFLGGDVTIVTIDEPGGLTEAVSTAADRTHRRRRHREAIRAVAEQLKRVGPRQRLERQGVERLLDLAPVGIVVVDATGVVSVWNRRAAEIFGVDEAMAVGRALSGLPPVIVGHELAKAIAACTQGESREVRSFVSLSKDGDSRQLDVVAASLDSSGPPGVLLILHDVTDLARAERSAATSLEREQAARLVAEEAQQSLSRVTVELASRYATEKQAATDLREAQRRLSFLSEASAILVSSLDYEQTLRTVAQLAVPFLADWCAVDLVDAAGEIKRLSVAHVDPRKVELAGELHRRFPSDRDEHIGLARVLRTGDSEIYRVITDEFLARAARSEEHLAALREVGMRSALIVPLEARGRTLGALSFVRSESVQPYTDDDLALAEDLARRAALAVDNARLYEAAQSALASRDELYSVISHDLKNPLGVIKGLSQLLQRRLASDGPIDVERMRGGLARIDATASRMTDQVNELLDFTRLHSGQLLDLDRRPTDIVALTRAVVEEHEASTDRHRFVVEARVPELTGEWDHTRLERVLGNLLSNAVKYSPAGGDIKVTLSRESGDDHDWAVISVRDQGVGIPARDRARIFEHYQRGGNVAGRISGTGVGLASVRQIVESHGGTVSVASKEGKGSTFTVRLPLPKKDDSSL